MAYTFREYKGADLIPTLGIKVGLRPEFLSEYLQNWPVVHFCVHTEDVERIFQSDIIFPVFGGRLPPPPVMSVLCTEREVHTILVSRG